MHQDLLQQPANAVAIECRDISVAHDLAARVATYLQMGDIVLLDGALAAGKTTFVSRICSELGVRDTPSSPTYVIANTYRTDGFQVFHIDAYRLAGAREFHQLGIDEYFPEAVTFIEWGERIADAVQDHLLVEIDFLPGYDEGRIYRFTGVGTRWQALIANLTEHPHTHS